MRLYFITDIEAGAPLFASRPLIADNIATHVISRR